MFDIKKWLEESEILHQDESFFDMDSFLMPDTKNYDKRAMRLNMCGTPRRYVNGQGRISKFIMRCKLPECEDCEKWRIIETNKDINAARQKLGPLTGCYCDFNNDEMKAWFRRNDKVRDYGRYPQEDGSTLLVMPISQAMEAEFEDGRFIKNVEIKSDRMYKSWNGGRRSGNLVNFRKKNRDEEQYSDESYTISVPIIEIEKAAKDERIAIAEVIAVAGTSQFQVYDKPEDLILSRNELLYSTLSRMGISCRYINDVTVRIEPSKFWQACPTIREITASDSSTSPEYRSDFREEGWKILNLELMGHKIAP